MLKISARKMLSLKCPKHPRLNYLTFQSRDVINLCPTCEAIFDVIAAVNKLESAERKAEQWIARTRLSKGSAA